MSNIFVEFNTSKCYTLNGATLQALEKHTVKKEPGGGTAMLTDPDRSVQVLWVAESNFASGTSIKIHDHDYYHFFMVRRGPVEFPVGSDTRTLNEQESMLAKPGTMHGLNNASPKMVRCYEIKFTTQSRSVIRQINSLPDYLPADPFIYQLVSILINESTVAEPNSSMYVSDYLTTLVDYCYRNYGKKEVSSTSIIDTTGFSDLSRSIVEYLEANSNRDVPLQEIADQMGFNKNYTCSAFKRDSGMTIGTCMTIIRIRKAAELISFSDLTLEQVAGSVGFSNMSHFNRIFKKIVGIPPGQYRRMFTIDMLSSDNYDPDANEEVLNSNGFIMSVLGRKQMTISDIYRQISEYTDQSNDTSETQ